MGGRDLGDFRKGGKLDIQEAVLAVASSMRSRRHVLNVLFFCEEAVGVAEAKRVLADPADPLHAEACGLAESARFDRMTPCYQKRRCGSSLTLRRTTLCRHGVRLGLSGTSFIISQQLDLYLLEVETASNGKKIFEGSSADEARVC